jgi:hypothetical protein
MRTYRFDPRAAARGVRHARALLLLLSLGSGATALEAQQSRYLVELGAGGLYQSFDAVSKLGSTFGGLGRVGVWLPYNFSLEGEGAFVSASTDPGNVDVSVRTLSASVLYNIFLGNRAWAHLRLGGGNTSYGDDCPPGPVICGSSGALLIGAGMRVGLTPDLLVRGDLLMSRNKSEQVDETVNLTNIGLGLGLSYMLGSKAIPDSDGDGILENRDRCPDTPSGAQVDGTGCPSDSDADGVPDGVDRCANTPPGASVNANGCTQDSDGDNIADGLDRCPDTESGVLVDPSGCPKDSDGDSIPDGLDRCSETPSGATVDALGCPGDEDGDGVLDGLDRCPRTPTGATINATGCPTGQGAATPEPQAAPPPARTPGTARLRPESFVALDSISQILQADTSLRVEIGAHTGAGGTPAQNQHLSNLQADAVRTYLVTKGVNFQQVQARGYGGTVPLTTDNTPRGRAANVRVEIKPATTGP